MKNVNASTPVDVSAISTGSASNPVNWPGLTTIKTNDIILLNGIIDQTNATSITLPADSATLWNWGIGTVAAGYLYQVPAGAVPAQSGGGSNASKQYTTTAVAFEPSAAAVAAALSLFSTY